MRWTTPLAALVCGVVILGSTAGGIALARTLTATATDGAGTLGGLQAAQRSSWPTNDPTSADPRAQTSIVAVGVELGVAPMVTVPALTQQSATPATAGPSEAAEPPAEPAQATPLVEPAPVTEPPPAPPPPAEVPVAPPYSTVLGWHGDQRIAYLTFDDGPAPATGQVLDILAATGVKATFCMVGSKVAENPDLARRVVAEGHTICNHSWDHHSPFDELPAAALDQQIGRTQDAIAQATGVTARYFRAPQGRFGNAGGPVLQACQRAGTIPLGWGVDSLDWERPGTSAVVTGVLAGVSPGAVILMHDGGGTDRQQTVESLPAVIAGLQEAGYTGAALPADPVG